MFYVYILQSEVSQEYYKGQTKDLTIRIQRHNSGLEKSTKHGVPWKLIWYAEKPSRTEAMQLERKLKNLSRNRLTAFVSKYSSNSNSTKDYL